MKNQPRQFVEASAAKLREFQERDLSDLDLVVLFLDGKSFADDEMVIALGVTRGGEKLFLGFVRRRRRTSGLFRSFFVPFWIAVWTPARVCWW